MRTKSVLSFSSAVLLACLLFASSVKGQLLGSSKCSWGPGYWCSDFAKARECSATSHCIQNYWSQLELPPDDDEVCAICKEMVAEARDTLQSNETREELKEVFEGSCKLIPIKAIANECINIFDDFVPELVEALASEMNPQIVCATAGLCNSERIDRLLKNFYKTSGSNNMCRTCRSGVLKLTQHLRQANPESLQLRLMDMCGELGSYSDACKVTVSESFGDMHDVLKHNLNDEVCDLMGVCSETYQNEIVPQTEDIECEFCEKVIQHWKDEWTSKTSIEEFKEVLDALCNKLHDTDRVNRCLHIVDDYYIPMFNFLAHEVQPKVICQIFGLCRNGMRDFLRMSDDSSVFTLLLPEGKGESIFQSELYPAESVSQEPTATFEADGYEDYPFVLVQKADRVVPQSPLFSIFPSTQRRPVKQMETFAASSVDDGRPLTNLENSVVLQTPTVESERQESDLGCELCKQVITALKAKVNNNTEEEIREKLEKMCLAFPQIVRSQCKEFVDKYTDQIINGIIRDLTAEEICSELHLCSKPKALSPPVKSIQCTICKKIINILEHELKNKKSEAAIRHALGQICKKIPFPLKHQCKKFVGKYTDAIVKAILKGLKPAQVCHSIHVCMVQAEAVLPPRRKHLKCKVCKKAVGILNSEIKNKTNDDEIKKAISTLCTKFPKCLSRQCNNFVTKYTPQLIAGIKKGLSPKKLCEDLQLCKPAVILEQQVVDNTAGCALCEYIIGELDVYLNQKGNRDSIEHALEAVCDMMSSSTSKRKCQEFVDTYINMILDTFTDGMTPKELCQLIYICQNVDAQTQEIGFQSQNQCKICDGIFTEIYEDVLDKEEEIKEALRNVCYAVLSGSDVDSCKTMVDTYVSMIISNIMTHDSPEAFCRNFYQCEDNSSEVASSTSSLHPNEIPPLEVVLSHEMLVLSEVASVYGVRSIGASP
eukprot:TRINITY_DN63_c0_g1_i2.p1 TRINITY_DN63_c0_g1~~TRINITY_DN63_c0_g1_i2.p1  ORF type:complete len:940 (-),score=214.19 TRINITY_DN63_c0_g1_i2:208-3027(-)